MRTSYTPRPAAGFAAIARDWAAALDSSGSLPVSVSAAATALALELHGMDRLVAAESWSGFEAERLGRRLAESPFDRMPSMLTETVEAFAAAEPVGPDSAAPSSRWWAVCAHVLTGYADAIRERALDDQEALLAANIAVREREIEALQTTLEDRATHDPLTGLINRTAFDERLAARDPDDDQTLSVLVVDLDEFKWINGSYGHVVADQVLRATAARLTQTVPADAQVARYGGDEFAIATALGREASDLLAQAVVDALAAPFEMSVGSVTIDASVGIATTGGEISLDATDLIHHANRGLAAAKAAGGRRFVRDDMLSEGEHVRYRGDLRHRLEVSTALRHAAGDGSLELHYQPIVETATGRVVAFEALLRWRYHGILRRPAFFMDIAENSAMIIDIGNWVIDTAVAEVAQLRSEIPGGDVAVSINVSARQLRDRDLGARFAAALEKHDLPASSLWIELTETALIADEENAAEVLSTLADLGLRLSLDDFGVGYSALSNLSNFPITIVKIDKSFVMALRGSDQDVERRRRVMIGSIQAMATALGIDTVAEGVEDLDLHHRIQAIGCTYSQGWFHGIPQPRERAFEWFRRGTPGAT
ncbi:hypothetical protein GCM10023147_42950 [Tsukamurella soli]|uniref:Diguanylate cyclase (GGDEF) domain-containing protein n=2 Tax=Tsukamurella soli TaxID=644556 RepID=A0ABP8K983_9ACTN